MNAAASCPFFLNGKWIDGPLGVRAHPLEWYSGLGSLASRSSVLWISWHRTCERWSFCPCVSQSTSPASAISRASLCYYVVCTQTAAELCLLGSHGPSCPDFTFWNPHYPTGYPHALSANSLLLLQIVPLISHSSFHLAICVFLIFSVRFQAS